VLICFNMPACSRHTYGAISQRERLSLLHFSYISAVMPTLKIRTNVYWSVDILLTMHLSIFILVIIQLDAQNLFNIKFISCLYVFRAPCAHRQEVKIVLYSLWYHYTYRWPSHAQFKLGFSEPVHGTATYRCDNTRDCIIQF